MSFPISGASTVFNAFWMGVPSLALVEHENERQSTMVNYLLSSVGVSGYVLNNEDDFISKATSLSNEIKKLGSTRKDLRQKLSNSVLCNPAIAAAGWEAALRLMWRRWCIDLDPKPFQLKIEDLKILSSTSQD